MNIVFITSIQSPFWLEFAKYFSNNSQHNFKVIFTSVDIEDRKSYWKVSNESIALQSSYDGSIPKEDFISEELDKLTPDVIIVGGLRNDYIKHVKRVASKIGREIIVFSEQPFPATGLKKIAKFLLYRFLDRKYRPKAYLVAGDRAVNFFGSISRDAKVIFFPYYQDLNAISRYDTFSKKNETFTFLFSGRFIERNNIDLILKSILKLYGISNKPFKFIFSGHGNLEKDIVRFVDKYSQLKGVISLETEFDSWMMRLNPYAKSHVLVLPSKHAGWGLVVPEAMSFGLPVISTSNVESARYLVDDYASGFLVEESSDKVARAMNFFLENPSKYHDMSKYSAERSRYGGLEVGSFRLNLVIEDLHEYL